MSRRQQHKLSVQQEQMQLWLLPNNYSKHKYSKTILINRFRGRGGKMADLGSQLLNTATTCFTSQGCSHLPLHVWHLARSWTTWGKWHLLCVLAWLSVSEGLAGTWTCKPPAHSPAAAAPLSPPLLLTNQTSITLAMLTHTHSDQKEHSGLNQIKIGFN